MIEGAQAVCVGRGVRRDAALQRLSSIGPEGHEKLKFKIPLKNQQPNFLRALLTGFVRSRMKSPARSKS